MTRVFVTRRKGRATAGLIGALLLGPLGLLGGALIGTRSETALEDVPEKPKKKEVTPEQARKITLWFWGLVAASIPLALIIGLIRYALENVL